MNLCLLHAIRHVTCSIHHCQLLQGEFAKNKMPNALGGTRTRILFAIIISGLPASAPPRLAEFYRRRDFSVPFRCFWNLRLRPVSVLLRSILLSYKGMFSGAETIRTPLFLCYPPFTSLVQIQWQLQSPENFYQGFYKTFVFYL